MLGAEARELLGFHPNSNPTASQVRAYVKLLSFGAFDSCHVMPSALLHDWKKPVKAAYRGKALESHPDRFPAHEKSLAESKFKLISEAYSHLQAGTASEHAAARATSRVVRTGFPRSRGKRGNHALMKAQFFLLILGTASLGVLNAAKAYQRQKATNPSNNPFLP